MPQHLLSPVTIPSLPCIFLRFIFASRHVPLKNLHASTQRISRCGFPSASQAKKNTNLTKMSALKAWTLVPRAKNQDAWRRLGALMSLSASQFEILKPTWLCGSDQEQIFGCFRLPHQLIWPACPSYPVRRPPAQDWRTVSPCFHFPLFPLLPLSLRFFFYVDARDLQDFILISFISELVELNFTELDVITVFELSCAGAVTFAASLPQDRQKVFIIIYIIMW